MAESIRRLKQALNIPQGETTHRLKESGLAVANEDTMAQAMLHRLGRLVLDREPSIWVRDLMRSDEIDLAPLTIEASAWAGGLPVTFPGDPIDRLLYATARDLRVPLVTKDNRLRSFARAAGDIEVIW